MKRKFELPSDFKVTKEGQQYHIKIIEKNPIWVAVSISLIGLGIGLAYFSPWNLSISIIGIFKLFLELKKASNVTINESGFIINEKYFKFESIKRIVVKSEIREGGSFATRGTFEISYIAIETRHEVHKNIGKDMINDYQHVLVYILRQFLKCNAQFIQALETM